MFEIRFHGRGGQGAVTVAELLAHSAIEEGKHAQAFPAFGPERRGAPVMAFARVSEKQILNRTQVYRPNAVVVLDSALLRTVKVSDGVAEDGVIVINSKKSGAELKAAYNLTGQIFTVDATTIAREEIGRVITNTTMLGALCKVASLVKNEHIHEALKDRFGKLAEKNIRAFDRAYIEVK